MKDIVLQSAQRRPFLADVFAQQNGAKKPIVIFTHGFQGFKDWGAFDLMASRFADAGFIFVKFNLSHNGTTVDHPTEFVDLEAFGHNTFSIELDDLGTVIDWVCSDHFPIDKTSIDTDQIYLIGHSRGGGIVILKAGEDARIKKIAPWASVSEFGKNWKGDQMKKMQDEGLIYVLNGRTKQQLPVYRVLYDDYFDHLPRLFIPDVMKNLTIPVLIVHGSNDDAVPYASALELKKWEPRAQLLTIDHGNHVFGAAHPWPHDYLPADLQTVVDTTIQFFNKIHEQYDQNRWCTGAF